jgi:predicted amidophosphoribosyltransferase
MCGKSMMELKELVEKETPKMVIIAKYSGTYIPPKCSVCGNSILNYGQHYCEDCGHKLDYPNEDENQMRLL